MQTVKRSWLLLLNWGFTALSILCVVAFFAFTILDVSDATVAQWGITPFVLGLAGIHLVYGVTVYPWFSKKNLWLATILNIIIYAILFAAIIETSGRDNYIIRFGYIIFMFFIAMSGTFPSIGGVLVTWVLYIFILLGAIESTTQEVITTGIINVFVTLAGVTGWLVFKKYYLRNDTKEVAVLSQLLEQEQFKSTVMLESITDGVMIINTQGTVQVINKSAATLIGWNRQEALHLDYRSLINPAEASSDTAAAQTAIDKCLQTREPAQLKSLLETKNKHRTYIDIVASPIFDTRIQPDGTPKQVMIGIIAILRDVDKQTRQEQQRSDFISTASHEMRTPVASIQGYLELALNPKAATIDANAKGYLEKAHEATRHLGALFQDLLTASQSEDGRLVNSPQIVDVMQFVEGVVEQEQPSATNKGLRLVFEKNLGKEKSIAPLLYVYIDPDRLREVLLNLIENAIKYTEAGMVTVGVSLNERSVVIRVADTGIGIAQEDLDHIFQKFYRTDNTKTRQAGGTGLGLYIAQQIVDMVHGRIWAESTPGEGSTFYVELPRISSEEVARIQNQEKT